MIFLKKMSVFRHGLGHYSPLHFVLMLKVTNIEVYGVLKGNLSGYFIFVLRIHFVFFREFFGSNFGCNGCYIQGF